MSAFYDLPLKTEQVKKTLKLVYHKDDVMGFAYDDDTTDNPINPFANMPTLGYMKVEKEEFYWRFEQLVTKETEATERFPWIESPDTQNFEAGTYNSIAYVTIQRYRQPRTTLTRDLTEDTNVLYAETEGFPFEFVGLVGSELFRLRKRDRTSFHIIYPVEAIPFRPYQFVSALDPQYFKEDAEGNRTWISGTPLTVYGYAPAFSPYNYGANTRAEATIDIMFPTTVFYDFRYGEDDKFIRRFLNFIPDVYWEYDSTLTLRKFADSLTPVLRCVNSDIDLLSDVDYEKAREDWLPYLIQDFGWEHLTNDSDLWRWQSRYAFQLFKRKGQVEPLDNLLRMLDVDFSYLEGWRDSTGELVWLEPEFMEKKKYNDTSSDLFYYDWQYRGTVTQIDYNTVEAVNKEFDINELVDPFDNDPFYLKDYKGQDFLIISNDETQIHVDNREILKAPDTKELDFLEASFYRNIPIRFFSTIFIGTDFGGGGFNILHLTGNQFRIFSDRLDQEFIAWLEDQWLHDDLRVNLKVHFDNGGTVGGGWYYSDPTLLQSPLQEISRAKIISNPSVAVRPNRPANLYYSSTKSAGVIPEGTHAHRITLVNNTTGEESDWVLTLSDFDPAAKNQWDFYFGPLYEEWEEDYDTYRVYRQSSYQNLTNIQLEKKDQGFYYVGEVAAPLSFDSVQYYDGVGTTFTDYTLEAKKREFGSPNTFTLLADNTDEFYVGSVSTFDSIYVDINAPGTLTLSAEYWNGSIWTALTITDNTTNLTTDGTITFTPPGSWAQTTVNGETYYWVRLLASGLTVAATGDRCFIGDLVNLNDNVVDIFSRNLAQNYHYFDIELDADSSFTYENDLTGTEGEIKLVFNPFGYFYDVYVKTQSKFLPKSNGNLWVGGSNIIFTTLDGTFTRNILDAKPSTDPAYDYQFRIFNATALTETKVLDWKLQWRKLSNSVSLDIVNIAEEANDGEVYYVNEDVDWNIDKWIDGLFIDNEISYNLVSSGKRHLALSYLTPRGVPTATDGSIVLRIPQAGDYIIFRESGRPNRGWDGREDGTTRTPEVGDARFSTGYVVEPRPYQRYYIHNDSIPIKVDIPEQDYTKRVRIYLDGRDTPIYISDEITTQSGANILYELKPKTIVRTNPDTGNEEVGLSPGMHHLSITISSFDSDEAGVSITLGTDILLVP